MRKMKANVLMAAYFITLLLVIVAENANGIAKISMLLRLDKTSDYKTYFQFANETFQQFYSCLRNSSWRTCIGSLSNNPPPSFSLKSGDKYVESVANDNQPVTFVDPDYFECIYDQSATQLRCQRFGSPCNTIGYFFFRLCTSTYCDPGCVRIVSNQGEEIRQENTDVVKTCSVSCNQSATTVTDTSSQMSTESFLQSTLTTPATIISTTFTSLEANGSSVTRVPAIVGATLACLVVIAAIIAGVILWKRKQASRKEQTKANNLASTLLNHSNSLIYKNQHNSNNNSSQNPGFKKSRSNLPQLSGLIITETEINTKQSKQARNQGSSCINAKRISTEIGYEVEAHNELPRHGFINNTTTCPFTTEHDAAEVHYEIIEGADLYINSQPSPKNENLESNNVSSVSWKTKDVIYKKDKDTNEIFHGDAISTQTASYYEEDANKSYENDENNSEFSSKTYYNTAGSEGSSENFKGKTLMHNDPYYNYTGLGAG